MPINLYVLGAFDEALCAKRTSAPTGPHFSLILATDTAANWYFLAGSMTAPIEQCQHRAP